MESDRESCDNDSTNSDNGGYDMHEDPIGQVDLSAFVYWESAKLEESFKCMNLSQC